MLAITNGSEKWDYAIAMLKIDGQSPSPEMLEMIEKEKKGEKIEPEPFPFLKMNVDAPSSMDVNKNILLTFEEPVAHIDTSAIHMSVKVDSLWEETPFIFRADSVIPRQYEILAEWEPEKEYQLKIDSAGIVGLYGLHINKVDCS